MSIVSKVLAFLGLGEYKQPETNVTPVPAPKPAPAPAPAPQPVVPAAPPAAPPVAAEGVAKQQDEQAAWPFPTGEKPDAAPRTRAKKAKPAVKDTPPAVEPAAPAAVKKTSKPRAKKAAK